MSKRGRRAKFSSIRLRTSSSDLTGNGVRFSNLHEGTSFLLKHQSYVAGVVRKCLRGSSSKQSLELFNVWLPDIARRLQRYNGQSSVKTFLGIVVNSIVSDYLREIHGGRSVPVKNNPNQVVPTLPMHGWPEPATRRMLRPKKLSLDKLLEGRSDEDTRRDVRSSIVDRRSTPVPEGLATSDLVRKAWSSLNKSQQDVVYLRYWRGLSEKNIGRVLNLSESRISKILRKAHEIIRRRLSRYMDE